MQDLHLEIKQLIIDSLNLEGLTPDDIDSQAPLFGDGLGLDSIDALELGLAIKGRYGIVLSAEDENTRRHFASVAALVALVQAQSKGEAWAMTRDDIFGQIKAALVELFEVDEEAIIPEARLYQDLELDSIDAIDLVVHLQKLTGKKIKPEEFKSVRSVNDVVDAVERLLADA